MAEEKVKETKVEETKKVELPVEEKKPEVKKDTKAEAKKEEIKKGSLRKRTRSLRLRRKKRNLHLPLLLNIRRVRSYSLRLLSFISVCKTLDLNSGVTSKSLTM